MESFLTEVLNWSRLNFMNVNTSKTKELIIGSLRKDPPPALTVGDSTVERVATYKLLGINIDDRLRWDSHVSTICSKAASRLYFLKQLKRSGLSIDDLTLFYQTVIRPVLEYACPAWHTCLNKGQSNQIETIQKRALYLIHGRSDYDEVCKYLDCLTLHERREMLAKRFFQSILSDTNCLHKLLPEPRDRTAIDRLRNAPLLVANTPRTNRFQKSLIQYGLNNFQ